MAPGNAPCRLQAYRCLQYSWLPLVPTAGPCLTAMPALAPNPRSHSRLQALSSERDSAQDQSQQTTSRVLELEQLLQAKHKELESVRDQLDAATRAAEDAVRERDVAEKKVARLERAKDDETSGESYWQGSMLLRW